MLMTLSELAPLLAAPGGRGAVAIDIVDGRAVRCAGTVDYPLADGKPVLVDFDRSILERDATLASGAASLVRRRTGPLGRLARRIVQGRPRVAQAKCREIIERLVAERRDRAPVVAIVGGGTIGAGSAAFYADPRIAVAGLDIYASPHTQVIADAHDLPLADGTVDAVWIQTVLEHVIDPVRVVAEIARVLRPGGYLYAETPFMQQVHEGAFDFTRFSQGGHRWLLRAFERVDDGVVEGPGVALRWSVRYFVAALTRSRTLGAIAGASLFWLRWLDRLADARHISDGAGCLYFFGRKALRDAAPRDVVAGYRGAQR